MTVSNAFNRPDQLSAALREQILATAERLGYAGPDPIGRALRRGTSDVVGVVLAEELSYAFSDPGSTAFLHGVTTAAESAGVSVQLLSAARGDIGAKVRSAAVDGVIVFGGSSRDAAVAAAQRRGLPVVLATGKITGDVPFVGVDNRSAAKVAAEHVRSLGHREVAVVAQLTRRAESGIVPVGRLRTAHFLAHAQRAQGYHRVFGDAVLWQAGGNSVAAGRAAGLALLAAGDHPSAVLASTDVLAIGVLRAADELGLRVGRDLAVTGFDDIDEASRSRPALTTVHQDLFVQGGDAFALLTGAGTPEIRPTRLVVRTSTTGEEAP